MARWGASQIDVAIGTQIDFPRNHLKMPGYKARRLLVEERVSIFQRTPDGIFDIRVIYQRTGAGRGKGEHGRSNGLLRPRAEPLCPLLLGYLYGE